MGNYKPFPFKIPFTRPVTKPFKRPFDVANDCVLCLVPEIRTKWFDQSINGNDGTIVGPTKVDGRFGMGLSFDGVDDYVDVGNIFSYGYSISLWFKSPGQIGGGNLFWLAVGRKPTIMLREDGTILLYLSNTHFLYNDTAGLDDDEWHHAYFLINNMATDCHIYIDSVLDEGTSSEIGDVTPISDFKIGIGYDGGVPFKGTIDEVEVFNRALTVEEIKRIYDAGKPEG